MLRLLACFAIVRERKTSLTADAVDQGIRSALLVQTSPEAVSDGLPNLSAWNTPRAPPAKHRVTIFAAVADPGAIGVFVLRNTAWNRALDTGTGLVVEGVPSLALVAHDRLLQVAQVLVEPTLVLIADQGGTTEALRSVGLSAVADLAGEVFEAWELMDIQTASVVMGGC